MILSAQPTRYNNGISRITSRRFFQSSDSLWGESPYSLKFLHSIGGEDAFFRHRERRLHRHQTSRTDFPAGRRVAVNRFTAVFATALERERQNTSQPALSAQGTDTSTPIGWAKINARRATELENHTAKTAPAHAMIAVVMAVSHCRKTTGAP
jgi:hypothetical protein